MVVVTRQMCPYFRDTLPIHFVILQSLGSCNQFIPPKGEGPVATKAHLALPWTNCRRFNLTKG